MRSTSDDTWNKSINRMHAQVAQLVGPNVEFNLNKRCGMKILHKEMMKQHCNKVLHMCKISEL